VGNCWSDVLQGEEALREAEDDEYDGCMVYDLATLSGPLLKLSEIDFAAQEWIAEAETGKILGRWRADIGSLGRIILLREFDTQQALMEERRRALLSSNPFNGNGIVEQLSQETYEGFSFLPPAKPRVAGGVYEFRTYFLKPGGLSPTLEAWREAIKPAKEYTDHLIINMFALDGPPRITHIWGFDSVQQRFDLRARLYAAGLWPPKGGPEQIEHATSTIALSNEGSPLS
jgi:NIPSNAP